jgi:hypothetical protein
MGRKQHSHKFTIGDEDAVHVLMEKLVNGGKHRLRRQKLLRALDDAMRHYNDSNQKCDRRSSTDC